MNLIDIHNNIYINTLSKTLITKVQNICHTDTIILKVGQYQ